MNRVVVLLTLFTLFTACSNSNSDVPAANAEVTAQKPDSTLTTPVKLPMKLDMFSSIPDTIDGCGDYYAADTDSAIQGRYIFLSNLTEFAIIRVSGIDIFLKKNDSLSQEITPDHFISVFEGSGFKATLEAKIADQYDEGGFYKGTLEILSGNEKLVINVHGETGC